MLLTSRYRRVLDRAAGPHPEAGSALASVIGVLAVTVVIAATLMATTLFSIGQSSSSRASVQALAAAEGGIDAAKAAMPACSSGTFVNVPDTVPVFSVQVFHRATASGTWSPGCPPGTSTQVRLVSTGTAQARGAQGQTVGDTRTMEAVFAIAPAAPEFTRAVYAAERFTTSANLTITGSPAGPDMVVNGPATCSAAMSHAGMLYVRGDLTVSAACETQGPVLVGGNVQCSAGMTILGDLSVTGNMTTSANCKVNGRLWVGGSLTTYASTSAGADLWVKGNLLGSVVPSVTGSVRVGGTVSPNARASYGARLTQPDAGVSVPTTLPGYDPSAPVNAFPQVTTGDSRWAGMTPKSWTTFTAASRSGGSDPCSPGGPTWSALTITEPTALTVDCGSGVLSVTKSLSIVLQADLVIFLKGYTQSAGGLTITSPTGEHALYLVHAWTPGATTCSTTQPVLTVSGGSWSQPDGRTRVLLYTAGGLSTSASFSVRGQVYACTMTNSASMAITYAPVGLKTVEALAPTSDRLVLSSTRDVVG